MHAAGKLVERSRPILGILSIMKSVGRSLVSGLIVYYAMAACSGGGGEGGGGWLSDGGGVDGAPTTPGAPVVPNAMADTWYKSGTRLKLRYYQGDDGSRQFMGFYDTQRAEVCSFTKLGNAVVCLPPASGVGTYWTNSACSGPLVATPKAVAPEKHAINFITLEIFEVAALYDGPIYSGSSASCAATGTGASLLRQSQNFYSVGTKLTAAAFAGASPLTE